MIKSSKQYEVTKRRLAEFESAIAEFDLDAVPPNVSPGGHRAARDALVSLRDQLSSELSEYERIRAEGIAAICFRRLADLPRVLIQTRIARHMTQKALAEALEVAPQQVQRWENEDYERAGLSYVLEIADILNVDEVFVPQNTAAAMLNDANYVDPGTWSGYNNCLNSAVNRLWPSCPEGAGRKGARAANTVDAASTARVIAAMSSIGAGCIVVGFKGGSLAQLNQVLPQGIQERSENRQALPSVPPFQGQSLFHQHSLSELVG